MSNQPINAFYATKSTRALTDEDIQISREYHSLMHSKIHGILQRMGYEMFTLLGFYQQSKNDNFYVCCVDKHIKNERYEYVHISHSLLMKRPDELDEFFEQKRIEREELLAARKKEVAEQEYQRDFFTATELAEKHGWTLETKGDSDGS